MAQRFGSGPAPQTGGNAIATFSSAGEGEVCHTESAALLHEPDLSPSLDSALVLEFTTDPTSPVYQTLLSRYHSGPCHEVMP